MNRSSLFIIIYIIGIILGAVFLDIWSSETTVAKGLIVLGWTALFLICLLYTDKKKKLIIFKSLMAKKFQNLKKRIINCRNCPRLIKFRKKIIKKKRKQYFNEKYWGKPITGFGDINGKILFVGLAPAAHGATRTGRVFTGDKSSDFLYKCLYNAKISNQNTSTHINDGLKLNNAFITASLKCVPPEDKPEKIELDNCSVYFKEEINLLKNLKVIVALGKIAFDSCVTFYKKNHSFIEKIKFGHNLYYNLPNDVLLVGCYHPSPRNVNTGRINEKKMTLLFKNILKKIN